MSRLRSPQQNLEGESSAIVVYPQRGWMLFWIALSGIPTLLCGLFALSMILLLIFVSNQRNQIGAILFLIALFSGFFLMGIWLTRMLIVVTFSGEPSLVIDSTGIRVSKIYGSTDIFLPWEEIEAVYSAPHPPYKILFVRPVDTKRFLESLSPLMRFTCGLSALGGAPIALYQSFLNQPAETIRVRIQARYQQELQLHKTQKPAVEELFLASGKREIILYTSRSSLWLPASLGGLALLFGSITLFHAQWRPLDLASSAVLLLLGVLLCPMAIWRTLRVPLLIIDKEGIASPLLLRSAKLYWEEIAAIQCITGKSLIIGASPEGLVALRARQNNKRLLPRPMDRALPQPVFALPQKLLSLPSDRLLEQIKTHFQDQLEAHTIVINIDEI